MTRVPLLMQALILIYAGVITTQNFGLSRDLQGVSLRAQQESAAHKDELKRIDIQLQQQSVAINRAIGTTIPFRLSDAIESEIGAIEETLQSEASWPRTVAEVRKLNDRLVAIDDQLSPWAQQEAAPRVLPLQWGITSLSLLADPPPANLSDLESLGVIVEAHLAGLPTSGPVEIRRKLEAHKQAVDRSIETARIAAATAAIEEKALERADELLSRLADSNEQVVASLRQKLQFAARAATTEDSLSEVRSLLSAASGLPDDDFAREFASQRAMQMIAGLRLSLLSDQDPGSTSIAKLEELRVDAEKNLEATRAARRAQSVLAAGKASREYQTWALQEISKVRTIKGIRDETSVGKPEAGRILRDEMVAHLAPINSSFLDVAVSDWYHRIYRERFDSLSDDDKLHVLKKFAETDRKSIE